MSLLSWAAAIPQPPRGPLGGRQITDPDGLAHLEIQHEHVLDSLRNGNIVTVTAADLGAIEFGTNEKRVFQVLGLAGVALIEAIGAGLGERLLTISSAGKNVIWRSSDYCRAYFETHAGGEENIQTFACGSTGVTQENPLK